MPELFHLYDEADFKANLRKVAMRGFTLRYRVVPGSKTGGTWIAHVTRRGEYVRVQSVDPAVAVEQLIKRIVEADKQTPGSERPGHARWKAWGKRPWKAGET